MVDGQQFRVSRRFLESNIYPRLGPFSLRLWCLFAVLAFLAALAILAILATLTVPAILATLTILAILTVIAILTILAILTIFAILAVLASLPFSTLSRLGRAIWMSRFSISRRTRRASASCPAS